MFTMMLLHMYQIFRSLRGHLHFCVHFFLTFMVNFFFDHPISAWKITRCDRQRTEKPCGICKFQFLVRLGLQVRVTFIRHHIHSWSIKTGMRAWTNAQFCKLTDQGLPFIVDEHNEYSAIFFYTGMRGFSRRWESLINWFRTVFPSANLNESNYFRPRFNNNSGLTMKSFWLADNEFGYSESGFIWMISSQLF